jgi:hypothetical protein
MVPFMPNTPAICDRRDPLVAVVPTVFARELDKPPSAFFP